MATLFNILLFLSIISILDSAYASHGTRNATSGYLSPPPQPPPPPVDHTPFKPSVTAVVAVLTTLFSVTFLLLLYAKHCKRRDGYSSHSRDGGPMNAMRKNSGVHRNVIQSLPVFRFGSLSGEKEGLECAVCLNRFQPTEVLRLLPKCKHAFHVECVDTWLEAHSSCPLCRSRVDPEDILLIGADIRVFGQNETIPPSPPPVENIRRVSGRHSTGELTRIGCSQRPSSEITNSHNQSRVSLDSWNSRKRKTGPSTADLQQRKDGLLLTSEDRTKSDQRRRLEHRIVIGNDPAFHQRWSDFHPSDLLYLRSEMIMSDSRRCSSSSRSRPSLNQQLFQSAVQGKGSGGGGGTSTRSNDDEGGRRVINGRSVSEITGLSRFGNTRRDNSGGGRWRRGEEGEREAAAGMVSRWLAWISHSPQQQQQTQQPAVRVV